MNKYELAVLLGGHVTSDEHGNKAICGMSEWAEEVFDEILDAMRPDYEPEDNEIEIRLLNIVTDGEVEFVDYGQYEGATFFIMPSWDAVKKLNEVYYQRYADTDNILRKWDGWGFDDEYDMCDHEDCENVIRFSPDSYSWQPDYWDSEIFGRICSECLEKHNYYEDYLAEHTNRNSLVNTWLVNPASYGWAVVDLDFSHGYYGGQRDNPKSIIRALNAHGIDLLFSGSVGQFDVEWVVWVHDDDVERATDILLGSDTKLPYDPAVELSKSLRGEHSDYYTRKEYTITAEEFVEGKRIKEILDGAE